MDQIASLSCLLGLSEAALKRHLQMPLAAPQPDPLTGWKAPELVRSILAVCDGFLLFGSNPWDSFRFWGSAEYGEVRIRQGPVGEGSRELGVLPIFGDAPHLTSIRVSDGVVISTDWENENGEG